MNVAKKIAYKPVGLARRGGGRPHRWLRVQAGLAGDRRRGRRPERDRRGSRLDRGPRRGSPAGSHLRDRQGGGGSGRRRGRQAAHRRVARLSCKGTCRAWRDQGALAAGRSVGGEEVEHPGPALVPGGRVGGPGAAVVERVTGDRVDRLGSRWPGRAGRQRRARRRGGSASGRRCAASIVRRGRAGRPQAVVVARDRRAPAARCGRTECPTGAAHRGSRRCRAAGTPATPGRPVRRPPPTARRRGRARQQQRRLGAPGVPDDVHRAGQKPGRGRRSTPARCCAGSPAARVRRSSSPPAPGGRARPAGRPGTWARGRRRTHR